MKTAAIVFGLTMISLFALPASGAEENPAAVPKLSPEEVEAMRKKDDVVILDVRTPRVPSSASSTWCPQSSSSRPSAVRASGPSSTISTCRG